MKKGDLHTRIDLKLKTAAIQDAQRRGMKLSKYVETALIHELNNKGDLGTIHELENLQQIIQERIKELQDPEEVAGYVNEDLENAIQDIHYLQKTMGYVTEGAVRHNATIAGVTFEEFLAIITERNITLKITN